MPRVAIYARYSSDLQSDNSIEDQFRICREYAERENWEIVETYKDRAESGASLIRPGIQSLLADAQAGDFDIVLAEALDRLSRDQADIATIYKNMTFSDIEMHTLSEGKVDQLHIGLKGTMNALFLKDLKTKIHRGMRGRIENGKSGGGIGYGYEVERKYDADGEPIRGDRTIVEEQAEVVRRIFRDYASGSSPRAIARKLNKDGVPAPRGDGWTQSSINGNPKRGTGILNNELYVGRLIWNRQKFIKNPETGKRVTRYNPESEWVVHDLPELRIVEDDLWDMVRERQSSIQHKMENSEAPKGNLHKSNRPKYLLSGLTRCGCCGGAYTVKNHYQLGCATSYNKGTCDNRVRVKREDLEQAVLEGLKSRMLNPELFKEFADEYTKRINEVQKERSQSKSRMIAESEAIERKIEKLVESIFEGINANAINNKLLELEARQSELKKKIEESVDPLPTLHPSLALRYRAQLEDLHKTLNDDSVRAEASDTIRGLIDQIVIHPRQESYTVAIEGKLASILSLAGAPDTDSANTNYEIVLVAEEGLEPPTHGL